MDAELNALIVLLDDPDIEIYQAVELKLLGRGPSVIPSLEKAWGIAMDEMKHQRIENIIETIQLNSVVESFKMWTNFDSANLLTGVYLIAKYQYPELNIDDLNKHFDLLKKDIWLELNNHLTALEKVKILNHIIFEVHRFSANTTSLNAPQNSYLNHVFETKKGNAITLGVIYSLVAQRLDLPIYGVVLPNNFILAYLGSTEPFLDSDDFADNILFYINPYNKGSVLGKREIDNFLKQQKIDAKNTFYKPCSNFIIIKELISSLLNAYEKLGYPEKIKDLNKLQKIIKGFIRE